LRNADNNLKLSQVSNEVHAISQVFTGGIYDVLADMFAFQKWQQRKTKDPAQILLEVAQHLGQLVFRAILEAPNSAATYADVVNKMLQISHSQGDPAVYRSYIRSRFTFREVVVSPTPLTAMAEGKMNYQDPDFAEGDDRLELEPVHHLSMAAEQDRSGCCGTMQLPEFHLDAKQLEKGDSPSEDELLAGDFKELGEACKHFGR
jgi:hypothetical protein